METEMTSWKKVLAVVVLEDSNEEENQSFVLRRVSERSLSLPLSPSNRADREFLILYLNRTWIRWISIPLTIS